MAAVATALPNAYCVMPKKMAYVANADNVAPWLDCLRRRQSPVFLDFVTSRPSSQERGCREKPMHKTSDEAAPFHGGAEVPMPQVDEHNRKHDDQHVDRELSHVPPLSQAIEEVADVSQRTLKSVYQCARLKKC